MSAEVTERWSAREFSRGSLARRVFDVTGVSDEAEALSALASAGVAVATGHPLDATLRIPPGGLVVRRDGVRVYVITANYEATTIGEQPPDLLAQKWRVSVKPVKIEDAVEKDREGRPLTNSFGDPFDQSMTKPGTELQITMWRWESTYEIAKHLAYAGKYNSDSVVLPKLGTAAPGELLVDSIELAEEVGADDGAVPVQYNLRARPKIIASSGTYHGFHRRIMDVGMRGANADGFAPITYKTGSNKGEAVTQPVRLDGNGQPLDSTNFDVGGKAAVPAVLTNPVPKDVADDAVFLLFDLTEGPIAFAGLNIGANL